MEQRARSPCSQGCWGHWWLGDSRDRAQAQPLQRAGGKPVRTHFPHYSQRPILREISVSKSKMLLECCLLWARMEFLIMIGFGGTGVKNPSRSRLGWRDVGGCVDSAPVWPSYLQTNPCSQLSTGAPLPAHPKASQEENIWQLQRYCVLKDLPDGLGGFLFQGKALSSPLGAHLWNLDL